MPNHVTNIVNISGDKEKIAEMLEAIKDDEYGIGTINFNKITPMPESLKITAGSQTERGLGYYKVCHLGRRHEEKSYSLPLLHTYVQRSQIPGDSPPCTFPLY